MKQKNKLGLTFLAAALAIGLAAPAFAQNPDPSAATLPAGGNWGLLGSNYAGASYNYAHTSASQASEWRGFTVDANQSLRTGLDFNFNYDWAQAQNYLYRLTNQDVAAGVTSYVPLEWGKPFVQALAGWEWRRGNGPSTNSFKYSVGTGVEFQVTSLIVVTPYVNFARATAFNQNEVDYGVKSAYRLNRDWSVVAGLQYAAIHHAPDASSVWVGFKYFR